MTRHRGAILVVIWVGVLAGAGAVGGAERLAQVRVATTGNDSERVKTLQIKREAGTRRRAVISLGPGELPDLVHGDRVRLTAELQVTTDCNTRGPRCRGSVYHYDPRITARLVLAPGPRVAGERRTRPVSRTIRETCVQKRPQYEHHCVLVFRRGGFNFNRPGRLPCLPHRCHVNLVAEAHHPRAEQGDLMMVGGQKPSGKIPQDRGRINAIRYRDTVPSDFRTTGTNRVRKRSVPPDFRRRVVVSRRLGGLEGGEQLAVAAAFRTDISGLPYPLRASARLILAESPNTTRPGDLVKAQAFGFGEIAENNGSNCTKPESPCVYNKVGVLEMRSTSPRPLFVNLVAVLGAKKPADGEDRVRIRQGSIRVVRFPPELRG